MRIADQGFTLIELMVTLSILAILLGLAAPSMLDLIRNNRVASVASNFAAAANYARAEAVRRSRPVTLCKSAAPSDSTPSCATSGDWNVGWLAFVDMDGNGTFNSGTDQTLRAWDSPAPSSTTITTATDSEAITYTARGTAVASRTVGICMNNLKRTLSLNLAGRLSIAAGTC